MRRLFVLFALSLITAAFFLGSCRRVVKSEAYFSAVSKYIYAYTSGAIGRNDVIRVRFVEPAVGADQIGKKVSGDIFAVSPSIKGDAIWEDDKTIKLQPTDALPFGARYAAKVALKKLFADVPSEAKTFDFEFSIRELSYDFLTEGLRAENVNDLHKQQIKGQVVTSDAVNNADIEKILVAQQGNKTLPVVWSHAGNTHTYSVNNIERGNVRTSVALNWSGEPLGIKKSSKEEIIVPALDEFVVLSAKLDRKEDQCVLLNFSDPLSSSQTLDGLIRLDGATALRFVVDGNFVRVYPASRLSGWRTLHVETGVRNIAGAAMKERSDWPINFEDLKPALRLVGRGAIIPQGNNGSVIFPFEAVGLNAVDVEVFKIYNSNILQYLQVNEIEGNSELERVGKIIMQRKISLSDLTPGASAKNWTRYALDLKDVVQQDPNAIYQIRLAFRKGYTNYNCAAATQGGPADGESVQNTTFDDDDGLAHLNRPDENGMLRSIMGGYRGIYWGEDWGYDEDGYSWERRDEPCSKEYYNNQRFIRRNAFVSDLGLMCKRGKDGSAFLVATDLHTAEPESGVDMEFYNYQLQPIFKTSTNGSGVAVVEKFNEIPFLVVASRGDRKGYLRMADGNALSLSRFDVAGVEPQKGLKGFIYGERGVWRPGDSLFLNFVLEDITGKLPENHPITFEFTDPKGSLQNRIVTSQGVGGVFPIHFATRADAPTGNWSAKVMVGGANFTQPIKIETVKPNRLKMDLDFGKKELGKGDDHLNGTLSVKWLHGAVAKGLKAKVEMQVRAVKTEFPNYKNFTFDDPSRSFSSEPQVLYDALIDDGGHANIPLLLNTNTPAPGKLVTSFKTRVFEKSGDFSTDNFSLDYYPYDVFVGVAISNDKNGNKEIDLQKGGEITFVCVDKRGAPMANRKLEVGLYRCDWRWWWDEDPYDNVAQFSSANHINALDKGTLTTNAKGEVTWKVKPGQWGRYLVRAIDVMAGEGAHCAGDFFWSGYPDDDNSSARSAATMLPFSADKAKYNTGEEVVLKVPTSESGKVLITLETGNRVIDHFWHECKSGDNLLKFKATEAMSPTVYAHVSLFQPHAQTKNDLPIRMYGVLPITVENPKTHLEPQLGMPDVLKPGENFTVSVSEKNGNACAYTLALVDEGLLDLTRFKTPNPWDAFNAREALGVKTWDMYDYVLGAYGAELERVLSIGGDGFDQKAKEGAQVSRFKPAVRHIGPFYLGKGKTAKHTLKIDNYIGSVRAMLVCSAPQKGNSGAYGMAEKAVPVRQALMILPTLPRVLGPGETLRLPVNVFAMEKKVKNASVTAKDVSGLVSIASGAQNLTFAQPEEKMAYFDLKVGQKTGVAKFKISATGGGETATEEIEILVRNPNPQVSRVMEGIIEPGQAWETGVDATQFSGLSNAVVEVSSIPPLNLSKQLEYLIYYPHGCVEQTTSGAFPQLYVDMITPLSDKQKTDVQRNVTAAIDKLQTFQTASGGFGYWPGDYQPSDWASTYAGHFLLESKNKGFTVPQQMLDRWLDYQTKTARIWEPGNDPNNWMYHDAELSQAYRLYTLALAGKADLGSMNRLRERKENFETTNFLLADAYASAGKAEVARELCAKTNVKNYNYDWYGNTYGSNLRDKALRLETYTATGDNKKASDLAFQVASEIGKTGSWYSTQELATGLRAISKYVQKNGMGDKFAFALKTGRGASQSLSSDRPIYSYNFTEQAGNGNVSVKNTSKGRLFARVVLTGQPIQGDQTATSNNIALNVRYTDTKGNPMDISRMSQGTDFIAEVTVTRNGGLSFDFNELALSQGFPSGWEIMNARMSDVNLGKSDPADYQDVRDDRVYTYFDLPYAWGNPNTVQKRTYRIQLNAAYAGKYYLPTVACEAMYDNRISAMMPGRWIEVI